MPNDSDQHHYADRAAKAIGRAEAATDPYVADLHVKLAQSYLKLAKYAAGERPSVHGSNDT